MPCGRDLAPSPAAVPNCRRAARRGYEQVAGDVAGRQLADRLWQLVLHVPHERHRDAAAEGHVDVTGNERQYRRRQIADDRILDPVEIWPVRLPVIEVLCYFDR